MTALEPPGRHHGHVGSEDGPPGHDGGSPVTTPTPGLAPGTVPAALAVAWTLVVLVLFAVVPFSSGTSVSTDSSGVMTETTTSSTIFEHEGLSVLPVLLLPVGVGLLGLAGAAFRWRTLSIAAAGLAVGFTIVGLLSIGVFYVPSAVLLVLAATRAGASDRRSRPSR